VVKGVEMFDSLKVPTLAVVENMAYYKCSSCNDKHRIFGPGYTDRLKDDFGIKHSFEVPILEEVSAMGDSGTPFVLGMPESTEIVQTYMDLAKTVDTEVVILRENLAANDMQVRYDPIKGKLFVEIEEDAAAAPTGETVKKQVLKEIDPYELRLKCKCAACIDEHDGRMILRPELVPKDVYPTNIIKKGHYAVAVVWSDGHKSSIYLFDRLLSNEFPSSSN